MASGEDDLEKRLRSSLDAAKLSQAAEYASRGRLLGPWSEDDLRAAYLSAGRLFLDGPEESLFKAAKRLAEICSEYRLRKMEPPTGVFADDELALFRARARRVLDGLAATPEGARVLGDWVALHSDPKDERPS
jgi:hypothetical protein